jgi:hypothetical protein
MYKGTGQKGTTGPRTNKNQDVAYSGNSKLSAGLGSRFLSWGVRLARTDLEGLCLP